MQKLLLFLACIFLLSACAKNPNRVLVFSKTEGFRHGSIEDGILAIQKLGKQNNYEVDTTEDSSLFNEENLRQYSAIVFLNTTGDVLNHVQQADFERYIQAGGGFVGVHAATDTEYDWKWYNNLVGAQFKDHPKIQEATMKVLDKDHPSTHHCEDEWVKTDEWYNFKNVSDQLNVLIEVDENSYEGGNHSGQHPISWFQEYDGGRAFYTAMGHTNETYQDSLFLQHLMGGLSYAMGTKSIDYSKATSMRVPEENRFVKQVLDFNLNEPMELDELPGRGILFAERQGAIKLYEFGKKKRLF